MSQGVDESNMQGQNRQRPSPPPSTPSRFLLMAVIVASLWAGWMTASAVTGVACFARCTLLACLRLSV